MKKLSLVNYDAWFSRLPDEMKEKLFNYSKFGLWCAKHKKCLEWDATRTEGGGYDSLTAEKPFNINACFDVVRTEMRCPIKGCHTKIIITEQRYEFIND